MFSDYKGRLILIAILCAIGFYYLLPSYSKYFKNPDIDLIFTASDETISIPPGEGVLLTFNENINRDCLSDFEFGGINSSNIKESGDAEDFLTNNSSNELNLNLDGPSQKGNNNLTIDWVSSLDECNANMDVCLYLNDKNLHYRSNANISKVRFSHNGCISKVSSDVFIEYNFLSTIIDNNEVKNGSILLGLDLQGGMYIQLEIDTPSLVKKSCTDLNDELKEIIDLANTKSINNNIDFFDAFLGLCDEKNIRLPLHFKGYKKTNNEDVIEKLKGNRESALQGAIKILRERIDKLGVSEPIIQKFGAGRIVVELAGVQDKNRTRKLIKRIASLELSLVLNKKLPEAISFTDNYFESVDSSKNKFSSYFEPSLMVYGILGVEKSNISKVELLLSNLKATNTSIMGGRFVWSNKLESIPIEDSQIIEYKELYFISKNPVIVGGMIEKSEARIAPPGSENSGQWIINLSMNRAGSKKWSSFTGSNRGERVAIILDDKVFMAPRINDKIPSGQTVISGLEDAEEAKDIANVLSAGELAAPMKIVLERSVSPSLGEDSINAGKNALIIALLSILIFILLYYRVSGLIANIALFLNIIFVLSILSIIEATLTLPGIAGLILTIGISIDSNVIIFERIKEELAIGKNPLSAVRSAYDRAIITIMDANITTLIAAFVLANIGSGPIKGFAITLSVGILCSMFTAIFVTKTLFMLILKNGKERISI